MSRPKIRKPKTTITVTQRDLQRLEEKATARALILAASYLMDDFGYDPDQILDFWDGVARYADAIDQKIISIRTVTKIIEEHTGLMLGDNAKGNTSVRVADHGTRRAHDLRRILQIPGPVQGPRRGRALGGPLQGMHPPAYHRLRRQT